jgi:4,5:9,10-diseco-3-hydroxy-5,9,17-trioxoandrosta-1(10),2-diene-4-oate hydrolase
MYAEAPRFFWLLTSPIIRVAMRPFIGRRRIVVESHKNAYFDKTLSSPLQVDLISEAHLQPGYREHFMNMAQSLTAASDQQVMWDQLPGIRQPVLIAWGRQDRALPVQHAYSAAQHMPGSELVLYDRCGHLAMYEKAEDFNRDLVDFLQRRL